MVLDRHVLMTAASALALGMAATPAFAQDAANPSSKPSEPQDVAGSQGPESSTANSAANDIVVTGVRASLRKGVDST
ncbi:MAG: hypothetical protein ACTHOJ_03955 [Sphingomonas oligoaromativorans]|jgi:hypothetical protein|uniref:hypothetical protein n=1 Tax=Sphingomonas oligoaromativorans TaxID=575322 RepID=UPI00142228A3|nr:hypothetical protein [Sphingomonas oligoaromativorans]NIJ33351.1 hypothetical protein [Sphingomonas oligoaromativorans]